MEILMTVEWKCQKLSGVDADSFFKKNLKRRVVIYFTFSASSAPGLNFTVLRAGISMACFVRGLKPVRAAFSAIEKVPKPTSAILSPSARAPVMALRVALSAFDASCFEILASSAIAFTKSVLFIISGLLKIPTCADKFNNKFQIKNNILHAIIKINIWPFCHALLA